MSISKLNTFVACSVTAIALLAATRAEAFHHRGWGSCGGSWGSSGGSWGSSGGSWGSSGGSWGSCGGYTVYYGSCGSSGGSWGSSGGSWGSSGGSSGGQMIYQGTAPAMPMQQPAPTETKPPAPGDTAPKAGDSSAQYQSGTGILIVSVPADAQVTVNGRLTTTTGTVRRFVSRGLQPGARYSYDVEVTTTRNGEPVTETKTVELTSGKNADLAFSFSGDNKEQLAQAAEPVRTTLVVNLPADAKLTLAGRDSNSTGKVREFTTTKLAPGTEWTNYVVHAEITRDGQVVTKEETLSLKAGDSRNLTFNFDQDSAGKVAGTDAR